jgi:putative transposase
MQRHCPALCRLKTIGGVCRRLGKWGIGRRRARLHLVSPDPAFADKQAAIAAIHEEQRQCPDRLSVLYGDEFTFYRQPTLGSTYHETGQQQPTVPYTGRANTKRRIVSTLDVATGQVLSLSRKVIGVTALVEFLATVRQRYASRFGAAHRLVLIWDNWPVHSHPRVVEAAKQQGIELLYLPTYAPWTNPIEKFWDKLKDQVLRLHRLSQEWPALCQRVAAFLGDHDRECPDLLRQVGLSPKESTNADRGLLPV